MRQNGGWVGAGTAAAVLALALPSAGACVALDDFPRDPLEKVDALGRARDAARTRPLRAARARGLLGLVRHAQHEHGRGARARRLLGLVRHAQHEHGLWRAVAARGAVPRAHRALHRALRAVGARASETEEQVAQRVQQRVAPELVLLLGPHVRARRARVARVARVALRR